MGSVRRKWQAIAGGLLLGLGQIHLLPVEAADIRLGGILPGGGVIHKPITSMREARYRHMVRQQTDFSCGAAALATILVYAYGIDVNEEQVIRGLLKVSDPRVVRQKGFSLLDIKNYVHAVGMQGYGYKINQAALEKLKIPVIALIDTKGYRHFVVLKKVVRAKVYLADPSVGNKVMPVEQFVAGWNDMVFAVVGEGFDRSSVLLTEGEPLSAKRLMSAHAPIPEVNPVDFGLLPTRLFGF